MKRLLLFIVAALLLPSVSEAAGDSVWAKCGATSVATATGEYLTGADKNIGAGVSRCFYFDGDDDSDLFFVEAGVTANIQLAPDVGNEGLGSAAIDVHRCQEGVTAYDAQRCVTMLDVALDGTGGATGTQTSNLRVGKGAYSLRNSVTANSDEAIASIEGE